MKELKEMRKRLKKDGDCCSVVDVKIDCKKINLKYWKNNSTKSMIDCYLNWEIIFGLNE